MGNLLKDGAAWLHSQRTANLGTSIVYEQTPNSVALTAYKHLTDVELDRGDGIPIESTRVEFVMSAATLAAAGIDEPKEGDTIKEIGTDREWLYEVLRVGTDRPYKWLDASRQNIMVFTRQIGTTP